MQYKQYIIVAILAFLVGMVATFSVQDTQEVANIAARRCSEVANQACEGAIKQVEVTKEVESTPDPELNLSEWRKLKTIDDQGFGIASEMMNLCYRGLTATQNIDRQEMQAVASEMNENVDELDKLANERRNVLDNLGY